MSLSRMTIRDLLFRVITLRNGAELMGEYEIARRLDGVIDAINAHPSIAKSRSDALSAVAAEGLE